MAQLHEVGCGSLGQDLVGVLFHIVQADAPIAKKGAEGTVTMRMLRLRHVITKGILRILYECTSRLATPALDV
jgi:hypothetical protein